MAGLLDGWTPGAPAARSGTTAAVARVSQRDEEQVQANEAANKKFPLAHCLLDDVGFKNNSYLENTLFSANEVSGLVQKQEGMGLSMGYQMAKVLKDDATGMKLMVVS